MSHPVYLVAKRNGRMWILGGCGAALYTPPDFVKHVSRDALKALAAEMTSLGRRDIGAIERFESARPTRSG